MSFASHHALLCRIYRKGEKALSGGEGAREPLFGELSAAPVSAVASDLREILVDRFATMVAAVV